MLSEATAEVEMNTSVDFFAGIVTLSAVALSAKFVTHRTRMGSTVSPWTYKLRVICVLASVIAVVLALVGLEWEEDPVDH
jgi:hypothetical protein